MISIRCVAVGQIDGIILDWIEQIIWSVQGQAEEEKEEEEEGWMIFIDFGIYLASEWSALISNRSLYSAINVVVFAIYFLRRSKFRMICTWVRTMETIVRLEAATLSSAIAKRKPWINRYGLCERRTSTVNRFLFFRWTTERWMQSRALPSNKGNEKRREKTEWNERTCRVDCGVYVCVGWRPWQFAVKEHCSSLYERIRREHILLRSRI